MTREDVIWSNIYAQQYQLCLAERGYRTIAPKEVLKKACSFAAKAADEAVRVYRVNVTQEKG